MKERQRFLQASGWRNSRNQIKEGKERRDGLMDGWENGRIDEMNSGRSEGQILILDEVQNLLRPSANPGQFYVKSLNSHLNFLHSWRLNININDVSGYLFKFYYIVYKYIVVVGWTDKYIKLQPTILSSWFRRRNFPTVFSFPSFLLNPDEPIQAEKIGSQRRVTFISRCKKHELQEERKSKTADKPRNRQETQGETHTLKTPQRSTSCSGSRHLFLKRRSGSHHCSKQAHL